MSDKGRYVRRGQLLQTRGERRGVAVVETEKRIDQLGCCFHGAAQLDVSFLETLLSGVSKQDRDRDHRHQLQVAILLKHLSHAPYLSESFPRLTSMMKRRRC